jgi:hypothetical protein
VTDSADSTEVVDQETGPPAGVLLAQYRTRTRPDHALRWYNFAVKRGFRASLREPTTQLSVREPLNGTITSDLRSSDIHRRRFEAAEDLPDGRHLHLQAYYRFVKGVRVVKLNYLPTSRKKKRDGRQVWLQRYPHKH